MHEKPTYEELEQKIKILTREKENLTVERDNLRKQFKTAKPLDQLSCPNGGNLTDSEKFSLINTILDAATEGIWAWNLKTATITFSSRYYTMLGYEPYEFPKNHTNWLTLFHIKNQQKTEHLIDTSLQNKPDIYKHWLSLIHPQDRKKADQILMNFLQSQSDNYENCFRLKIKSGEYRWLLSKGKVVERDEHGTPSVVIGSHEDITQQKLAEMKIKENEAKYIAFFHTNPAGLAITSLKDGLVIELNESMAAFCGYNCSECINRTSLELGFWADPLERKAFIDDLQSSSSFRNRHMNYRNRSGDIREGIFSAEIITLNGEACIMTAMFDVTELIKSNQALKTVQTKNQAMVAAIPDLLFLLSRDYRYVECLAGDQKLMVSPRETLLGRTLREMLPSDVALLCEKYIDQTLETGQPHKYSYPLKIQGETKTFELRMIPYDAEHVMAIVKDITSDIMMEKRLNQAQKMEAMGTMAGGIAHDFNNILSPIMGYAEMVKISPHDVASVKNGMDEILKAGLRAKELINQILSFSRQRPQAIVSISLHHVIKECLNLLRSSIPTTIEIQRYIDESCGPVMADPSQIHQIVMNLAANAFHAMEESGGILHISYREIDVNANNRPLPELNPGKYAALIVRDTGTGIKKDIQNRVFEPYFTTKELDKGTGLGLSMVHGIIKNIGGFIKLDSEIGEGTQFHIYLPVLEQQHKSISAEPERLLLRGNGERILFVDDDPSIGRMVTSMFKVLGYQASILESSVDALKIFKQNPNKFDLLIADMTMPGMTGIQLTRKIRGIRSDLPVIISSGLNIQIDRGKYMECNIDGFISKPYTIYELSQKISPLLQ